MKKTKHRNGMVEILKRNGNKLVCRCDCGRVFSSTTSRFHKSKSCGCLKQTALKSRSKIKTGDRFGFLEALNPSEKDNSGNAIWSCRCFCGKERKVRSSSLLSGKSKSCGCVSAALRNESFYANHPELAQKLLNKGNIKAHTKKGG